MKLENWQIARDPENSGREQQCFKSMPDAVQPAPVPGIIQNERPAREGAGKTPAPAFDGDLSACG